MPTQEKASRRKNTSIQDQIKSTQKGLKIGDLIFNRYKGEYGIVQDIDLRPQYGADYSSCLRISPLCDKDMGDCKGEWDSIDEVWCDLINKDYIERWELEQEDKRDQFFFMCKKYKAI